MADYGAIGAYLGGDAVISPRIDRGVICLDIGGGVGTTLENRRPMLIDALVAQIQKTLLAPWAFDYVGHVRERDTLPDTTGAIRGTVEADGDLIPGIAVHLYYNPTGEKIATTFTGDDGSYEFLGMAVGSTDYTAMSMLDEYNNAVETRMAAVAAE